MDISGHNQYHILTLFCTLYGYKLHYQYHILTLLCTLYGYKLSINVSDISGHHSGHILTPLCILWGYKFSINVKTLQDRVQSMNSRCCPTSNLPEKVSRAAHCPQKSSLISCQGSFCVCRQPIRWCYNVTSSLIGWVHTQNDPCI